MDLHQIILNILIVSIPETFFLTFIILILMGKVEFITIDNWKRNLFKIMLIIIIPFSIFSNVILAVIPVYYNVLINIIFISIFLCILLRTNSILEFFKILSFSTLGMIVLIGMNLITLFLCKFILDTDTSYLTGINPIENFKVIMPERFLECYILLIAFIKVNGSGENNLIGYIDKNRNLKLVIFFIYLINLVLFIMILKSFILDNSLFMVETGQKIVISTVSISSIILNLAIPWIIAFSIYSGKDKEINNKH